MNHKTRGLGNNCVLKVLFVSCLNIKCLGKMNSLCHSAAACALSYEKYNPNASEQKLEKLKLYSEDNYPGSGAKSKKKKRKKKSLPVGNFNLSLTHEICSYAEAENLLRDLKCAFKTTRDIKQLIILRL